MPKSPKSSLQRRLCQLTIDDSMNSEDQKDMLKQLVASISVQVERIKESNKISRDHCAPIAEIGIIGA